LRVCNTGIQNQIEHVSPIYYSYELIRNISFKSYILEGLAMTIRRALPFLSVGLLVSGCSYPRINEQRYADVSEIVSMVECELVSASNFFPTEVNQDPKDDKWDIGTTLDLTLVSRVDADGKVSWAIPVVYSLSPSVGGSVQDTITAHVVFATSLVDAKKEALKTGKCLPSDPPDSDPSRTGLGLAAWIRTSFTAIKKGNLGGISYTKIFELRGDAGARFGYVFAPINLDVGAGIHGTKSDQIVVGITPRGGPTNVVIVGDTRTKTGSSRLISATSASKTFSNPNLNNLLNRQAPLHLLPGQQPLR
jgi:hypothetical protein